MSKRSFPLTEPVSHAHPGRAWLVVRWPTGGGWIVHKSPLGHKVTAIDKQGKIPAHLPLAVQGGPIGWLSLMTSKWQRRRP